jgi:hypothetical protein
MTSRGTDAMGVFCAFWIPTLSRIFGGFGGVYALIPLFNTPMSRYTLMIRNTRRQARVTTCENFRMLIGGQRGGSQM